MFEEAWIIESVADVRGGIDWQDYQGSNCNASDTSGQFHSTVVGSKANETTTGLVSLPR